MTQPLEEWVTVSDVIDKYKGRIGAGTIEAAAKSGELETFKPGRTRLTTWRHVNKWIESTACKATAA